MAVPRSHSSQIKIISSGLINMIIVICLFQMASFGAMIWHSIRSYQQAVRFQTLDTINRELFETSDVLAREQNLEQVMLAGASSVTQLERAQVITLRSQANGHMARALGLMTDNPELVSRAVLDPLMDRWAHFVTVQGDVDRSFSTVSESDNETQAYELSLASHDLTAGVGLAVHELTRELDGNPDDMVGRLAEASYLLWQIRNQVAADGAALIVRAQIGHLLNSSDEAILGTSREFTGSLMSQLQTEMRFLHDASFGYSASGLNADMAHFLLLCNTQIGRLGDGQPSPLAATDYRQQTNLMLDRLLTVFNRVSFTSGAHVDANTASARVGLARSILLLLIALGLNLALLVWLRRHVLAPLNLLSTIQDAAREAILLVDAAGLILMANRGAENLFGLSLAQLRLLPIGNLMPDVPLDAQRLSDLAACGEELRVPARDAGGNAHYVSLIASALPKVRSTPCSLVIVRDDHARYMAEESNRQSLDILSESTRIQNLLFTEASREQVFSELLDVLLRFTRADGGCLLEIREGHSEQTYRCRASKGLDDIGLSCSQTGTTESLHEHLGDDSQWMMFPVELQSGLSGLMGVRRPHIVCLHDVLDPLLGLYASILGFVVEEDSRKQSSVRLREVLRQQEALFSASPAGLIQLDEHGFVVRTNLQACKIFGVAENSLQHQSLDNVLNNPDAWRELAQRIAHINLGQQTAPCELECRSRAGTQLWVLFEIRPLYAHRPQADKILSCIDITTLKQTEQALREARDAAAEARSRLIAAIEAIPEAFAFYDEHDQLVVCNQQYANLFFNEMEVDQMIGKTFEECARFSIEHDREDIEEGFDAESWLQERIRRHRMGQVSFVLHLGEHWYMASDHLIPGLGSVCLRSNITALKAQEQELRQAKIKADEGNRAKSAFLASISHEIRTPLNGILGLLELLRLTQLEQSQQDTLASVQESAKTLLRLIDDILDFSKIEAGKLELAPEPVSVKEVLTRVYGLYQELASGKSLQFSLDIDPGLASGHLVDPLRLRQILQNFVSNAIKFTAQGTVLLNVKVMDSDERQQTLCFSCKDSGIGISPESLRTLFRPFTQAESSTTRRFGGTGLGLSICKRLGELMGGEVALESLEGQGTTASFTLSLALADVAEAAPVGEASPLPSEEKFTLAQGLAPILFVEDNPINRKLTMMQLERIGIPYKVAENGQEAFEMWKQEAFSLVLTDCHMPIMDGHQLAQAIRQVEAETPGLAPVPIIACTANAGKDEADRAFAAGMNEVLTKPISLDPLRKMFNTWLGHSNETGTPKEDVPPAGGCESAVDRAQLNVYSQGDLAVELSIVQDFLSSEAEDLEALRIAVSTENHKEARWFTHRIKGAGRMVGAMQLASSAEALENCAKQGAEMAQALTQLEEAFLAVEKWLAEHQRMATV